MGNTILRIMFSSDGFTNFESTNPVFPHRNHCYFVYIQLHLKLHKFTKTSSKFVDSGFRIECLNLTIFFQFLQHVNVTTKPKSAITKLADATAQPKESLEKSVIAVISLITIMGILSRTLAIVSTLDI